MKLCFIIVPATRAVKTPLSSRTEETSEEGCDAKRAARDMGYSAQTVLVNRVVTGIRDFIEQRQATGSGEREINVDK
jgi:hypothetical protein